MPREQRLRESALLKERWHLIQSGVPRSNIKIKENRLYVGSKLHGSVIEDTFRHTADHSIIAMPNLEMSEPARNVVDSPCIVEGNRESDCHVPSVPTVVQQTMPSDNASLCLSHSSTTSVSPTSPPLETPPKPKS